MSLLVNLPTNTGFCKRDDDGVPNETRTRLFSHPLAKHIVTIYRVTATIYVTLVTGPCRAAENPNVSNYHTFCGILRGS